MLKIRLARGGAKKKPYYQIVVADSRAPRDGKFIERVGSYNPLLGKDSPDRVKLNVERIQEWMSKGAQPTERVARFLSVADVRPWTHGENPTKGQPGKKAQERAAERTQRETDRAEAEATARAEAAAAPPPAPEPEPETAPEPAEDAGETAEAAADTAAEPTEAASDETPTEGGEAEAETEAQPS